MSSQITMQGIGSNLPISDWISQLVQVKQTAINSISTEKDTVTAKNSALSTVKSSYSSLLSSIQKITDSSLSISSDLFASNGVTTSDSAVLTASVTSAAAKQSLSVVVTQLASNTKVQSTSATPVGSYMDNDTKFSALANGAAKAGTLSVYVDGTKNIITIGDTDTVGQVLSKISSATGLNATVSDGKINISSGTSQSIVVGSTSDTSNFSSVTALKKNAISGAYESNQSIFEVNSNALLTSTDSGFATQVKVGSFKIGDATFTIDSTTTLSGLIEKINSTKEAKVSAYWDTNAGKMVLNSTEAGAYNVNVENVSGNFTDVVGLTASTYDGDGKVLSSKLVTGSQTLGNNAILSINGTQIISHSNTVTSDISGVSGLTLNLKSESTGGKASTVAVSSDSTGLVSALQSFVSSYNSTISNTDTATGSDGYLYGENTLTYLRNDLRQTATASVSVAGIGAFTNLASIGITTGAVGSALDTNTNQLVIDTTKLKEAIAADPEKVKKLLIGDGVKDGVLKKLSTSVSNSLDPISGYFVAKSKTYTSDIDELTDTIDRKTTELTDYKTDLTKKFSDMDALIARLNQQLTNFKSALGITN